jgi:hypothetical protein
MAVAVLVAASATSHLDPEATSFRPIDPITRYASDRTVTWGSGTAEMTSDHGPTHVATLSPTRLRISRLR